MNEAILSEEQQRQEFVLSFDSKDEKLFCEVPVFCRSIDLVKYNLITGNITAIEFKRKDWKRAINQALCVSICFDYLEICVPKPKTEKTKEKMITECSRQGIGLYFYDEYHYIFTKVLEPAKVNDIWEVQKTSVIEYVGGLVQ